MTDWTSPNNFKIEMRPGPHYMRSSEMIDMHFSRYEVLIGECLVFQGTEQECRTIMPALEHAKDIGRMQGYNEASRVGLTPPYIVTCKDKP